MLCVTLVDTNKLKAMKTKCKICGSEDIEIKVWYSLKTKEVNDMFFTDADYYLNEIEDEDTWCVECAEHTGIKLLTD